MSNVRRINRVLKSMPTIEGAGVHLKRAFGNHQAPLLDPFLLLDDFHSNRPSDYVKGFPWHPHRGIETITYVLEGRVEHGDSMDNQGVISPGDVQWMTAGSGIIHQEMPLGQEDGLMWGFQLWANLPRTGKMMPPRYRDVTSGQIPEITTEAGARIKIICGEANGVRGPVRDMVIDPEYLDITVPPGSQFRRPVRAGATVLAYVIEGAACFDEARDPSSLQRAGGNYFDMDMGRLLGPENLVVYDRGDEIRVDTAEQPVRFLLISGQPIGEPVAWYGPIVMNTQEELRIAFEEYQNGTFIK
ncbi:MAG: pirin family protein [Dehalococcoidia bacterium]|nr:pirin family protein [Dehalococcoidia bacterium]